VKLLVIDNYDSFTYNLVQRLGEIDPTLDLEVKRNDRITLDEIAARDVDAIVISPGPCTPNEAGISVPTILRYAGEIPILGVCLGHQSIGQAFGGRVVHAKQLMHSKTSQIRHQSSDLFAGLPNPFEATRYHSLAVAREDLPGALVVTAETEDGEIMGMRHSRHAVFGVQFHPESILTVHGKDLLANFLRLARDAGRKAA